MVSVRFVRVVFACMRRYCSNLQLVEASFSFTHTLYLCILLRGVKAVGGGGDVTLIRQNIYLHEAGSTYLIVHIGFMNSIPWQQPYMILFPFRT